MARILALDYGTKRTGIAVTDPLQMIATSLTTVRSHLLFEFLDNYFKDEKVERIVLGKPTTMNNLPSENAKYVDIFEKQCKVKYPHIPITLIDERFTSKMAHQTLIDSGIKKIKRQNKEIIDTISATIILQSYMEQKNNGL